MGPGYKGPNFHGLRGYYLAKAIDEVKIFVESCCNPFLDPHIKNNKITSSRDI